MKKTAFLSVMLFATAITFGQGLNLDLPKIIPPSPAAQTFMRYGEIPVDYSTGVPNIDIPIFTVEGKQLKVPISISYHASGIKVNDIASEVGLGWALNCGGLVSRSINGKRDEAPSMPRTYDNAAALLAAVDATSGGYDGGCMNDLRNFEDFFNRYYSGDQGDPMKDRFFYKLPTGVSGIFTYDYVSGDPITLPYRHLKIEKNVDASSGFPRINNLKITDDNGIVYTFITVVTNPLQDYSEWFIKDMTSADGIDKITFNYVLQTDGTPSVPSTVNFLYQGWAQGLIGCLPANPGSSLSGNMSPLPQFTTPVLESIVSSKAVVKFEYAGRDDFNNLKRLSRITIAAANAPTAIIKQVDLLPKYFGATAENKRLGLDGLIIGAPNNQPQKYVFNYESQVLPPYPFKMNTPAYSEDFWGYYNGNIASNAITGIPADFITDQNDRQHDGGNREAGDYGYAKACMLKEIKYPTGGRTVFDFERYYSSNAYPYHTDPAAQDGYYGGFRVASITNYSDDNTVSNVKTYEYELPVTRQIQKQYYSFNEIFIENRSVGGGPGTPPTTCGVVYSRDLVFSNPLLPLEVAPGMPVMYQKVTEYNGTPAHNAGKTVFTYDAPYSPSDYFNNIDHPVEFEQPQYYHPYNYDKGNYVPEMNSKTIYSYDGTIYHPLSKDGYLYSKLFTKTFNTGIKLSRTKKFPGIDYWCFSCANLAQNTCTGIIQTLLDEYKATVVAVDTKAYQEASLLTNSKSYVYDPLDETKYVLTSTGYTYNEANLEVNEKTTLSSKGEVLKTAYKYPHDNTGSTVYNTMVGRNILTPALEEQHYKNSNFLQSTKTNYDFWNGSTWSTPATNIIVPRTVETQFLSNAPQTRLRYHSYDDNGNVTSVSKEDDVKKSYIWTYDKNYPIAEVLNAETKDIFYTSFEDAEGNSPDGFSKTGKKSRTGGYTRSLSNLTNGTYVLSWWQKNGSKWDLQVNTNIVVTNGTYSINLAGQVDEVRFYPAGAQMTTYTVDPLIGVTSECNAGNHITYYEYDVNGRLQRIRDQDRNIIKLFCYNYAGQPENCSGTVYSSTQSRTYTATGCTVGGIPSQYTYTYTATSPISPEDAYDKAIDYINLHGQNEADFYLHCTYFNDLRIGYFQHANCDPGFAGTWDNYTVEAGTYYSYISKEDANAIAENDLNTNGPYRVGDCVPKYINCIAISSAPSDCYSIEFWDRSTGFDLWCDIPSGGSLLGSVPYGDYHITVHAACSGTRTYNINYDGNSTSVTSSNGVNMLDISIHDSFQIFIQ